MNNEHSRREYVRIGWRNWVMCHWPPHPHLPAGQDPMSIDSMNLAWALAAFREHFASHIGAISALFQAIPRIDTGHDGCDIWLCSADGLWVTSVQPTLNMGHKGEWTISVAPKFGEGWGQWVRFVAVFDAKGALVTP